MAGGGGALRAAAPVLHLYRRILRVHAAALPPPMAALAGPYVREEFRAHLASPRTTPEQWRAFVGEWTRYCELIAPNSAGPAPDSAGPAAARGAGGGRGGAAAGAGAAGAGAAHAAAGGAGALEEELERHLSEEQRVRLRRLKAEALKYGRALLSPPEGERWQ